MRSGDVTRGAMASIGSGQPLPSPNPPPSLSSVLALPDSVSRAASSSGFNASTSPAPAGFAFCGGGQRDQLRTGTPRTERRSGSPTNLGWPAKLPLRIPRSNLRALDLVPRPHPLARHGVAELEGIEQQRVGARLEEIAWHGSRLPFRE
jgi:hypothetical protein